MKPISLEICHHVGDPSRKIYWCRTSFKFRNAFLSHQSCWRDAVRSVARTFSILSRRIISRLHCALLSVQSQASPSPPHPSPSLFPFWNSLKVCPPKPSKDGAPGGMLPSVVTWSWNDEREAANGDGGDGSKPKSAPEAVLRGGFKKEGGAWARAMWRFAGACVRHDVR